MHPTSYSYFFESTKPIPLFRLFYALFTPYFYIQMYASFRGVPPSISSYLLAILNAMNVPSRVLPGILADRFGPYALFHFHLHAHMFLFLFLLIYVYARADG